MVRSVYAVKASLYGDPFCAFPEMIDACDCAVSMHPDWDARQLAELVVRLPLFESFEFVDGRERGICCSEEVFSDA